MKRLIVIFLFCTFPLFGQSNSGELRIKVIDPGGLGVKITIQITSKANRYRNTLTTSDQGGLDVQRLPYGIYQLEINHPGFAGISESVDIHSSIPTDQTIQLRLPTVNELVTVSAANTLIDPDQAGAVNHIGSDLIQNRLSSIPGRSLQDLVNSQPGWIYEGNVVLHPRGSEYQTQFVVDGIPLTDNRSPSFGPAIDADDVQSLSIYTAGIPAEYGRKMGGVVEVNTLQDSQPGFHGQVVLSGGSFDSAGASAQGQYVWGKNVFGGSASGSMTDHYLNPVVPQNYSNSGTLGDFSVNYERELTSRDRLRFIVRHELSRYDIPNEQVQEAAGQRRTADNIETMGIASYEHVFSSHALVDFRGMVRNNANDFNSNTNSTPIEVFQHNWFREGYFKGTVTVNHGRHEFKFGVESDNTFLNENFKYIVTDPTQFDPGTPSPFSFVANRPDLEQSGFVQDLIRFGNWTANVGLRWDHYQLILNRQAVDPRVSISRYFPCAGLVLHFSYDRVFQTPSFENILLSSSTAATNLAPVSLQLPVAPSQGNYYEVGLTKTLFKQIKLETNYFRRLVNNYADDDQINNTSISFPIAFRNAIIYGADAKIDLPDWRRFSGFVSYSYTLGNAFNPVTGGLFLGANAVIPTTGHFPDSQDQRNTIRGRLRYQVTPRFWVGGGIQFDSGLPFEFSCDPSLTLQQCVDGPGGPAQTYGRGVVNRINFARGRIYPSFQVNASAGADVYKSERMNMRLQIDGQNLTNVLDVIDFGGLFSGNAIGPSRSVAMRLTTNF
ncbi:MAG TPA: TonB-dependent receptor plug domain-containing protein [Candidatus Polarisedimenticolia bacterium]|nr:TonB-dependent receptor plug domain-containing protein [Candidatus Polarisedimenticolia bacterium]